MTDDQPDRHDTPLKRAQRSGQQAAQSGFDWPDASGPLDKIREELHELDAELHTGATADSERVSAEIGDLLFAVVNLARHLDVDASAALGEAVDKFDRRFERVEQLAAAQGCDPGELSLDRLESMWEQAKSEQR